MTCMGSHCETGEGKDRLPDLAWWTVEAQKRTDRIEDQMHRSLTFPFWGRAGQYANVQVGMGSSKMFESPVGGTLPCMLSEEADHVPMPSTGRHTAEAQV